MKTPLSFISISLLIVIMVSACGPSQAALDATTTQIAADIFATQTAQAPTITPTFTPSLTPTLTWTPTRTPLPTNTSTPIPTSTPTRTPTPTPRPAPLLLSVALTQDDLPAGFKAVPAAQLQSLEQRLPGGSVAFGFADTGSTQTVIGFLYPVYTAASQAEFDERLPQLAKVMGMAVGAETDTKDLRGLGDIGDARAGISTVGKMVGVSLRWDILGFRRGKIAALVLAAYPDGNKPLVPTADLARVVDKRAARFLATGLAKTTLTIWQGYRQGGPEQAALSQIIAAYKKANPDVTVNVLQLPYDTLLVRWESAVASGGGPDLITAPNDRLGREARLGVALDLTAQLKGKLGGVSQPAIDGMTVNGKLYGVPMLTKAVALFYNKSAVLDPPSTTGELMTLVKSGNKLVLNASTYYNFGWFTAFGGVPWNDKGECVNTLPVKDAYQFLADLQWANPDTFQTDGARQAAMFSRGQADITIDGPWMLMEYKKALGNNLGVALMPAGPSGKARPLTGIDGWYINARSNNADAALDLALYVASKEGQTIYANVAGDPPARTDVTVRDPLVAAFASVAANGYPRPQAVWFENFWGPFDDSLQKVLGVTLSPVDGAVAACVGMNRANGIAVPVPVPSGP